MTTEMIVIVSIVGYLLVGVGITCLFIRFDGGYDVGDDEVVKGLAAIVFLWPMFLVLLTLDSLFSWCQRGYDRSKETE